MTLMGLRHESRTANRESIQATPARWAATSNLCAYLHTMQAVVGERD